MRTLLTIVLLSAFAGTAFAQSSPVALSYRPGAPSTWSVTEVRTQISQGEGRDETEEVTTYATLTIRAAAREGYQANWVVDRLDVAGFSVTNEPEYFVGLDMRLTLDEDGTLEAVEGWDELQRRIFAIVEEVTPPTERTAEWRRGLAAMRQTMAQWSPSNAAEALAPSLAILSICQGVELQVGDVIGGETWMPNMLGGPPILAIESLALTDVDRDLGVAHVVYTRSLDPESATVGVREALANLARQSGQSVEDVERAFSGATFTHDTRVACVVDLQTGVAQSVIHEVNVSLGPARRTDRREITVSAR